MLATTGCPFCSPLAERVVRRTDHALAVRDAYPVSPGHTLIVSRRHVGSLFELTLEEQYDILRLLGQAKAELDRSLSPHGYNVGINDGAAAGQTVPHVHVHLIPRYTGDRSDPRGGVRWIFPDKADYWTPQ